MARSLRASEEGIKQIKKAMKQGDFTQKSLTEALGISRSVITVLMRGEAIAKDNFEKICDYLMLDCRDIRGEDVANDDDLDLLVQEVKQKIAADVTERCGTMRMLDMTQPVDLDRIYTDVNILNNLTRLRRYDDYDLKDYNNREGYERFLVGSIQERVQGFEAVEEFQKLVVLGKPGAGKTTFMKYLAMSCLGDRFHGELVPIFVTLKAYAEDRGQPTLENYILTEFAKRKVSQDVAKHLLDNGKALILLDGLDEVKKEDDRRVKQDIDQFSRDWLKNRFAITCRIAAREYQFEKFAEVEVADFDDGQIETFVNNWFRERDESKAERLLERLKGNKPVKELAKSPLLLTLLCLVFGERNDFPPKRSELYKEGLEVLMKKWDAKRNIEREIIYKHLSPQNKEDMLGQIAFNTFVNGEYFFRQEDLQRQIKDYICNLPDASADPDALRLDSEAVLKAIEHHHGLLVERARNIYSFSHLTFQEYFTAQEIERERHFEKLIENITNPRWKEVFYLTAEMLRRSDNFLRIMKDCIDEMTRIDPKLYNFLEWLNSKSIRLPNIYKPNIRRSIYIDLSIYCGFYDRQGRSRRSAKLAKELGFTWKLDEETIILDCLFSEILQGAINLSYGGVYVPLFIYNNIDFSDVISVACRVKEILSYLENLTNSSKISSLNKKLPALSRELYSLLNDEDKFDELLREIHFWWRENGRQWIEEFRQLLIDEYNIGHDWQFTKEQAELLNQYYEANLLLVECMNRSYVSKQVREEIEATMLLPSKK
ncbi:NACHT C-terminal helical domain 2-containing protein [Pseudanabaena mucicola]|uniref:NACHT domain-containing protein n=1 Tax=Pseudanabaena mucicola FACHB-723 TaxID=2692860 RepID=A0ABR7ZW60_9CYAN|nr:NACHT domain-containing protein [Pseudanabaena mucicola]MBD2187745.1 NACHT domain-containing protein [Pseudanabaena mucicola FACHB-723]